MALVKQETTINNANDNTNESQNDMNNNENNNNNEPSNDLEERTQELSKQQLPLQYRWTLWHTAPTQGGGWSDDYKQIAHFDTVETFWRLFNNIAPPSLLQPGSSYHLFKGKVKPAWEDKFNKHGGALKYVFGSGQNGAHNANYSWYHTVLNLIGNNFELSEEICGVVVNIKKQHKGKIELWIKDASNEDKIRNIGKQFKMFCNPNNRNTDVEFQV